MHIKLADARRMIDQIIAERGEDYVYPYSNCQYAHGVGPRRLRESTELVDIKEPEAGCGVGVALINEGLTTIGALLESGSSNDSAFMSLVSRPIMKDHSFTDAAKSYLYHFQDAQDNGKTWGESKEAAEMWSSQTEESD